MTDLFLVFVAAAMVANLVLVELFDAPDCAASKATAGMRATASLLLAMTIALDVLPQPFWQLPLRAMNYLHALTFICLVMALPQNLGPGRAPRTLPHLQQLRDHLPLLTANLSLPAFALLDHRHAHNAWQVFLFCLCASAAFLLIGGLLPALRQRMEASAIAQSLRGTPTDFLTAGLMALAAMPIAGLLAW